MTNVPTPVLTATGYAIPSLQSILAGVVQDFQAAYGSSINLSATPQANGQPNSTLATVQGQQATTLAATVYDCYSQLLAVTSQTDPQYAQGLMQDGIGNIYFMSRFQATGTQVTGICLGLTGTVIGAGSPATQDAGGSIYSCSAVGGGPVTIALGGTAALFTNMNPGPTPFVPPMTIYQTTAGWDSVTTSPSAILGTNVETAQQFETRRQMSVSINSLGLAASIKAAILALTPVSYPASVYVVDNPANVPVPIGGLTLPANSVYIASVGYQEFLPWSPIQVGQGGVTKTAYPISSVAQAIFTKKSLGCCFAPGGIATLATTCSTTSLLVNNPSTGFVVAPQTLIQAGTNQPYLSSAGNGSVPIQIVASSGNSCTLNFPPATPITSGTTVWFGSAFQVSDPTYPSPQPSYLMVFTEPLNIGIYIQVTLAAASNPSPQAASMLSGNQPGIPGLPASFAGTDGLPAVSQIGATVYASRFYPQIAATLPGVAILSVFVSNFPISTANPGALQIPTNINRLPVLASVTVVTV
jgi:hypothetical protein